MSLLTQQRPVKLGKKNSLSTATWRRVPKINLLPKQHRLVTPLVAGLALTLVVALVMLLVMYNGLSKAKTELEDATSTLGLLNTQRTQAESANASLDGQISGIRSQITSITSSEEAHAAVIAALYDSRTDWTIPLSALLQADSKDIRFRRISAVPDGTILITGAVTNVVSMNRFQEHLLSLHELIDIISGPSWKQDELELSFTLKVMVK